MSRLRIAAVACAFALLTAPPAGQAAGQATVGGGSFNTAPLLAPGRYSDTVAAGETVYWKVRLQKGQVLTADVTVDTSSIESDSLKPDYDEGLDNLDYYLDIHSPLREPYGDRSPYQDASVELSGDSGAGSVAGAATGPRVLGFEEVLGPDFSIDKFTAPGETFVSLNAADSELFPTAVPAELPVDLELRVEGAPQPSSPDFASALPRQKPAPPEKDTRPSPAQPDPGPSALGGSSEGDPTVTILLVAGLTLLAGLVLGALAAVTRRNRALDRASAG